MQDNIPIEEARRLVIVDPHVSGHHSAYIRRIVEGAIARNMECLVITSEAPVNNPEFSRLNQSAGARVEWAVEKLQLPELKSSNTILLLFRQFMFWRYFRKVTHLRLDSARDRVLAPYLDNCSYAIGLLGSPFGSTPWAGISMRPMFHFANVGIKGTHGTLSPGMQKYLFERMARDSSLVRLFFIDETVLTYHSMSTELRKKSRYLPDPAEQPTALPMHEARRALGVAQQDTVILMYGAISKRKGFALLLKVLASPKLPVGVIALIVGRFDTECREALCRWLEEDIERRHRIVFKDYYVSSAEEAQCLSACDMVWLAYENHLTMSGVLVQAGQYRKPVLGTDAGLIGWYIARQKVGVALPANSIDDTVATISHLTTQQKERMRYGMNGHDTFTNNTIENFQHTLFGKITNRLPNSEPFA